MPGLRQAHRILVVSIAGDTIFSFERSSAGGSSSRLGVDWITGFTLDNSAQTPVTSAKTITWRFVADTASGGTTSVFPGLLDRALLVQSGIARRNVGGFTPLATPEIVFGPMEWSPASGFPRIDYSFARPLKISADSIMIFLMEPANQGPAERVLLGVSYASSPRV